MSRPVPTARWPGRPASQAFVQAGKGEPRSLEVPSTVGGLAFAPKGVRLAIAHYNGVSLWFPNAQAAPEMLEWKGSHHHVAFSPNGQFLVTAMQEPTLHGWRVVDAKHMRMSGYSARVRSFAWTAGGKWLATVGLRAARAVAVPGQGRPDGQAAEDVRGLRGARHRRSPAIPSRRWSRSAMPTAPCCWCGSTTAPRCWARSRATAPVTALGWDAAGTLLAWGTEAGEAGVIDLA